MADSESIVVPKETADSKGTKNKERPDDLTSLFTDVFKFSNIKIALFIFFLFIILSSDIFIDKMLSKVTGAVDGRCPTGKGTIIQGLLLVLCYIIFDMLVRGGFL